MALRQAQWLARESFDLGLRVGLIRVGELVDLSNMHHVIQCALDLGGVHRAKLITDIGVGSPVQVDARQRHIAQQIAEDGAASPVAVQAPAQATVSRANG